MKQRCGWAHRWTGTALCWVSLVVLWAVLVGAAESTYVVQRGDTLHSIAKKFDADPRAIAERNHLTDPDRLEIGQRLEVPQAAGAEKVYVVRKGDVLSGIAQRHHVSVEDIVNLNRLSSPDQLRIGDELRIPARSSAGSPSAGLPEEVRRALAGIRVTPRRWRYIVIHHSGTDQGTIAGMDRYHREERGMENGIAYHFVIGNGEGIPDGRIEITSRWRGQLDGGHVASAKLNRQCIGICLIGNFENDKPSPRQMDSLAALSDYLLRQCRLSKHRIKGHRQINTKPTRCPGKNFRIQELLRRLPG